MKKTAWALGALMLLPASAAFALGPVDIELEVAGWQSSISGETRSGGVNIDLKNDLGLDDKSVVFLRGRAHLTFLGNLYVGITPLKYDASSTLTRAITYEGKAFSASTPVTTNVDLKTYDLGWTFSPLNIGILEAEIGANVKFISGNVTVKSSTQTAQADFSTPVPMLKAVVRASGPFVSAEVDGMAIAYADNHLYDVTAQVKLNPFPFMYVAGGYRFIDLELTDGDKAASMKNKGPFLGIGVDF